jgi:DUF4097 and DUF4098 domain-containing protein YvlB
MRTALLAFALLAASAPSAGGQQTVNQTIPTSATGEVHIHNVAGRIRVVGWDQNRIQITGTLGPRVERLSVEGPADRTQIRVVLPSGNNACSGRDACSADLEIRVPSRKGVVARGTSASVEIAGISGEVSGQSTSGSVTVSGSPANVDAHSTSGNVRVSGTPIRGVTAVSTSGNVDVNANTRSVRANSTSGRVVVSGSVSEGVAARAVSGDVVVGATTEQLAAETVSGNVSVTNVSRRASVTTVSGNATIRGGRIENLAFESVSGDLRYEGEVHPNVVMNIQSHSGRITLALPAGVAARFRVSTFSGSITNGLGPAPQRSGRGPGQELQFGDGSGVVTLRTFSGNIRLQTR